MQLNFPKKVTIFSNLRSKFELVKFLFFQLVIHYLTSELVIFPILINELVKGS